MAFFKNRQTDNNQGQVQEGGTFYVTDPTYGPDDREAVTFLAGQSYQEALLATGEYLPREIEPVVVNGVTFSAPTTFLMGHEVVNLSSAAQNGAVLEQRDTPKNADEDAAL